MRNHDGRQVSTLLFLNVEDRVLHIFLTLRIEGASSLVKDEYLRSLDESASNRNSLLLSA